MSGTTDVTPDSFEDAEDVLTEALAQENAGAPAERGAQAFWRSILVSRNLALTLVAVIIFVFFALTTETFLTSNNLFNMLRNVARAGIVAVGMTYLMIAGEIDLSVGSVFGFLTVVLGVLVVRNGVDLWVAALAVVLLGALVGLVNGLIRTRLGIPSFIVTLAMLTAYRSLAITVSEQKPWNGPGEGLFYDITGGEFLGAPWQVVWMLIAMVIGGLILARTKFGYHVYATGGSLEAARNSGINTDRVKLICFMLTSGLCGFIALLLFGDLNIAAPITGTGFELSVIGAVIVGGVALTGGRGTIYGVFIGAIIIGMISSGLVLLGFSQHFGDIATGILIVAVGTLDLITRRAAAHSLGYLEG
jgi:ribose/xylose/arabinose/galactoside ABC-type transport system permease subunit